MAKCFCSWEIAPWASLTALCFALGFDLQPMLESPFLASADTFVSLVSSISYIVQHTTIVATVYVAVVQVAAMVVV